MPKIKVGEKALAHLSRGLYRSPASALRELVSNAWDASATLVRITTNYPHFHLLSIEDNGRGFPQSEFIRLMEGGIGNSLKRTDEEPIINDRPVIGRLGIGMLGIAQVCGSFRIISKTKGGEGFHAKIDFYDLLRERLDTNDESVVKTGPDEAVEEVDVGDYSFLDFDPDEWKVGTTIITEDVHPTFVRSFQESVEHENFTKPPRDWGELLKIAGGRATLQELGDYWRLIWELAASCPIPYLDSSVLPDSLVADEQARLQQYDFRVLVDGIELRKPIRLTDNPGGYTTLRINPVKRKVYGRLVEFHGYIAVQEGSQLKPDELRGVMIRIKNVGIGYYDASLLDYRYNEGPRSRWLTGEIYVDSGLENALNIDRDSFNRFHPEFRFIQTHIHDLLQNDVFPRVYRQIDVRSKARATKRESTRQEQLRTTIEELVSVPVRITYEEPRRTKKHTASSIRIRQDVDSVEVTLPSSDSLKTKKSHKPLASAILAIFAVAIREKSDEERTRVFTEQLLNLLSKW